MKSLSRGGLREGSREELNRIPMRSLDEIVNEVAHKNLHIKSYKLGTKKGSLQEGSLFS
jgi:hypothetical protein